MPSLVLDLLKLVFILVVWIFVARVIRLAILEMRPDRTMQPAAAAPAAPTPSRPPSRRAKKTPKRLAVIEGDVLRGKSFDLKDEIIIGRADKCHLKLDDSYVSQVHARIFANDEAYMVEDLGSTNGTYLNRNRVTSATELQRGDRVKIGKTVMELRR
ncbi:MAG: FHA domain-containing protein FhaB/FipA [Actinomycetota bacterium]